MLIKYTLNFVVLVEKMLRSTPVGKIYVLVKADEREAAIDRLQKEVSFVFVFLSFFCYFCCIC